MTLSEEQLKAQGVTLWGIDITAAECRQSAATGCWHLCNFLTREQQDAFAGAARSLKAVAPFAAPTMRDGTTMGVRVTSFGARGWWADRQGYRYTETHPTTGAAFPPVPGDIWGATAQALSAAAYYSRKVDPAWSVDRWGITGCEAMYDKIDTCLVNFYSAGTDLGWHVDRTEKDLTTPIVTFSIGATCTFEIKLPGADGEIATVPHALRSGDAIIMAGLSRRAEHRVVRVRPEPQRGLFGGDYYNPIEASGARLSFTVRRTGL